MPGTGSPRGRRWAQLDAETIVEAGLRLTAADGTNALSFRKLGAELGADPTSVYRHFRDKDALVAAMLDRLLAEGGAAVDASLHWRPRLIAYATETVRVLSAHPAVGMEAGSMSTSGPAELDAMEHVLAAFGEAGLDGDDLVRFYGLYTSYVLSFSAAMAAGRLARQPELAADDHWVPPLGRVDPSTHPSVARLADALESLRTAQVFATGLDVIMDAAEAAAKARPSSRRGESRSTAARRRSPDATVRP
jgi:AcrR family transcriptional regulator